MKVSVISPSFYPAFVYGGTIFSVHHTCAQLAALGVDIFVSTTNANGKTKLAVPTQRFVELAPHYAVKYYDDTMIGRFSWRFVASVWRDIKACDLIRVEDVFSTYIPPALLYARLFRKPVLISARGVLSRWSLASKRPLLKKIWIALLIRPFLDGARWHATSKEEEAEIQAVFPDAEVVVIPNGVDMTEFCAPPVLTREAYLRKFGVTGEGANKVIVSMGRLHKKKGFDILIDAFAGLPDAKTVLLIAGTDDGERSNLESQIARLGIAGKVHLVGEVSGRDKVEFLAGADVFVLPSYSENFGNVYLEALAAGVPIVASKGTPWEQVEAQGCGKWVENSVDKVRCAIAELLRADRALMGRRAKLLAEQYDWRRIASEFLTVFDKILAEAKA